MTSADILQAKNVKLIQDSSFTNSAKVSVREGHRNITFCINFNPVGKPRLQIESILWECPLSLADLLKMVVFFFQLFVNVIDINDHRPTFTERIYNIEISENVDKGTEILRLIASDEDEDKKLFYSLHAARNPVSLSIFKIDSISGLVTLNEKLDRYVGI